jgi:peptidoglycan lytic transglycosylase D
VAKILGGSSYTLRELNPELRRSCTPPDYPGYELKIPKGMSAQFLTGYAQIPEEERYTEQVKNVRYRAKRRDTLDSIARRFKTTPQSIAELNNLGEKVRSLKGRLLTIPVQVAWADEVKTPARAEVKPEPKSSEFQKYYTVQKGDTLHSLAKRFNVTARLLSAWNNLKSKVALKPGRRIIVAKYQEKKGALVRQSG